MIDYLGNYGIQASVFITAADNRVRYMPHVFNLAVQDILTELQIPLNK